jgi:hypothetical protein
MTSRVRPAKQSSMVFIPPLDGEGVALEERDGWGEYPSVEKSPHPTGSRRSTSPQRGRYERVLSAIFRRSAHRPAA